MPPRTQSFSFPHTSTCTRVCMRKLGKESEIRERAEKKTRISKVSDLSHHLLMADCKDHLA